MESFASRTEYGYKIGNTAWWGLPLDTVKKIVYQTPGVVAVAREISNQRVIDFT